MTQSNPYKKSWLCVTHIARDLICLEPGERIATVQEYTEKFDSSRGIIQNALQLLQEQGAVVLEKKGKTGCFIKEQNMTELFRLAELDYIMGSMPPPLTPHYASLASGICADMESCPASFNFSFMHSGGNRAKALSRSIFDFSIVSLNTANCLIEKNPQLSIALELPGSIYSPAFQILSSIPEAKEIKKGARIASDPNSPDQYSIACHFADEFGAEIVPTPYMTIPNALRTGRADFMAARVGEAESYPFIKSIIPIGDIQNSDMVIPAVLVHKSNYGIAAILRKYLNPGSISQVQRDVLKGTREASFY